MFYSEQLVGDWAAEPAAKNILVSSTRFADIHGAGTHGKHIDDARPFVNMPRKIAESSDDDGDSSSDEDAPLVIRRGRPAGAPDNKHSARSSSQAGMCCGRNTPMADADAEPMAEAEGNADAEPRADGALGEYFQTFASLLYSVIQNTHVTL